jgi:hypothetical protein
MLSAPCKRKTECRASREVNAARKLARRHAGRIRDQIGADHLRGRKFAFPERRHPGCNQGSDSGRSPYRQRTVFTRWPHNTVRARKRASAILDLVHRAGLPFPAPRRHLTGHRKRGFYLSACPTQFFLNFFTIRGLPARSGSASCDALTTKADVWSSLCTLLADYSFSLHTKEEGTVTRLYG